MAAETLSAETAKNLETIATEAGNEKEVVVSGVAKETVVVAYAVVGKADTTAVSDGANTCSHTFYSHTRFCTPLSAGSLVQKRYI